MEFLIDRNFWYLIIKKLTSSTALLFKNCFAIPPHPDPHHPENDEKIRLENYLYISKTSRL